MTQSSTNYKKQCYLISIPTVMYKSFPTSLHPKTTQHPMIPKCVAGHCYDSFCTSVDVGNIQLSGKSNSMRHHCLSYTGTPPSAKLEASTCITKGLSKSGNLSTGSLVKEDFNSSNVALHLSNHVYALSFFRRYVRGQEILE